MALDIPREKLTVRLERALLVSVALPNRPWIGLDPLEELQGLASTAGAIVVGGILQKRIKPHPGTYIGKGKVDELIDHVQATDADVVVFDNDITNMATASGNAVAVWFEVNQSFATATVTMNNFNVPATQYGILVGVAGSGAVNGTCNWWNSPTGPTTPTNPGGTGAKVSSLVNYNPWLIAPAPGGACFGGNVPTIAGQCKNGGWTTSTRSDGSTFKNQGDCIQYVNTGK